MAFKFGSFLTVLAQVGPMILLMNPKTAAAAPVIIHAIQEAQALKGSTGPEKKAHALAIIKDAAGLAHAGKVKGFEDPDLVLEVASDGIDTVVGAVKVIAGMKVAVDGPDTADDAPVTGKK